MLKAKILLVGSALAGAGLLAADQTAKGTIGDPSAERGKQISDRAYTQACVKKSGKYVLEETTGG